MNRFAPPAFTLWIPVQLGDVEVGVEKITVSSALTQAMRRVRPWWHETRKGSQESFDRLRKAPRLQLLLFVPAVRDRRIVLIPGTDPKSSRMVAYTSTN